MFKRLIIRQLYFILSLCFTCLINSQNIQYDLRCSADGNSYEVYVTRDVTSPVLFAGSSTITLVLPTGNSRVVSHQSRSVSTYNQVTPIIDGNGTGNDYYPFNTSGGSSISGILTANTPVLWLTLTPSDGTNQEARLFVNGVDPSDIDGVNPSNIFSTLSPQPTGTVDEFSSNVSDDVINCSTLSTSDIVTVANIISVYPNPFKNVLQIVSKQDIRQIELFDISGKLVYVSKTKKLLLGYLQQGIYLLNIHTANGSEIIRVVKE